jgi:hypothetical protein
MLTYPSTAVRLMLSKTPRRYTTHATVCVNTCAAACKPGPPAPHSQSPPTASAPGPTAPGGPVSQTTQEYQTAHPPAPSPCATVFVSYGTSAYVSTRQHTSVNQVPRPCASVFPPSVSVFPPSVSVFVLFCGKTSTLKPTVFVKT